MMVQRVERNGLDGLDGLDIALVVLFLIGLYSHYTIQITTTVPFPAAPAGIAGVAMLWRRRNEISAPAFIGFMCVLLVFLLSIVSATDLSFLPRRFHGLIQLVYSLVIGYALFLTLVRATREQVERLFLTLSLIILVGCLLEQYGPLRPISDAVRNRIYTSGVYELDIRDEMLYGHVRPKFFASEPSAVSLCYTIFSFTWMVVSRWRWKLPAYIALIAAGFFATSGPTLLLMFLLLIPYQLFIAGRAPGTGISAARLMKISILGVLLAGMTYFVATAFFAHRLHDISEGSDPSFFYRVEGPILAAQEVLSRYPIAGAGLTGEPFIEDVVVNAYIRSPAFSRGWHIASPATELLINYFWLHWIYLGLVWGTFAILAVSGWLRSMGVRQVAFCWIVWVILGQASGAYVGPMTWAILFLAAAAAQLYERAAVAAPLAAPVYSARLPAVTWRALPPRIAR